jgi:hypothetical protein
MPVAPLLHRPSMTGSRPSSNSSMQATRSMYYYRSRMDPQTALRQRMRKIAHARVRFGYRRIYITLRREGSDVGKDCFYRVYREENLGFTPQAPWRHVSAAH